MAKPQQNRSQRQRHAQRVQNRVNRTQREAKAKARFTEPLTPKRAMHVAKANANLEYRPLEREIQSEIRGSRKKEGEIARDYAGIDSLIAQQQVAGKVADDATTAAINSQLANAGAQSQAGLQQLATQNASRAAMTGGAVSPTLQSTAALGAQNVAQQRVALNAPTIAAQSSFQKFTGGRRVSAAERGIEARKANASNRRKMVQDKLNASLEKGRAVTSGLQKLREGDRDYKIQNKAFGLNRQEAAEKAANDLASQQATREGHRLTRQSSKESAAASREGNRVSAQNAAQTAADNRREREEFEYEQEHGTGSINSKSSGKQKGPTQSQKYNANKEAQSVRSAIPDTLKRYRAAGHPIKSASEWAEFTAEVAKITGADYNVVAREVNRFRNGAGQDVNGPNSLGR